jgi:hypothetical protein
VPGAQGTWGLRQEGWDGDSSLGVAEGESIRDACEQSRLPMLVAVLTEQGVEQASTGDRGGVRGEEEEEEANRCRRIAYVMGRV